MDYIWLISVPLVAGVLIYAAWILGGRKSPAGLGRVASVVAIVAVAWTLWQAIGMFQSPPPPSPPGGPIDLGPLTLALRFRADGLSTLIVLAASGIALMVTLYSYRAMAGHDRAPVYYAWVLWTVSAVTAAALANTFLILILAWEVATVLLYLLIGLGQPQSRAGAMKTFAILGFADLCLLLGVMLLFQAQGGANALLLVGGEGAPGPAGTDRPPRSLHCCRRRSTNSWASTCWPGSPSRSLPSTRTWRAC